MRAEVTKIPNQAQTGVCAQFGVTSFAALNAVHAFAHKTFVW